MNIEIFLLWIGIAIIFFVGGISKSNFVSRDVSHLFLVMSGFMVMMSGLFILVDGVDYKTGSIITTNSTGYIVNYSYNSIGGFYNSWGLSAGLMFIGVALIIFAYLSYQRQDSPSYSEEED